MTFANDLSALASRVDSLATAVVLAQGRDRAGLNTRAGLVCTSPSGVRVAVGAAVVTASAGSTSSAAGTLSKAREGRTAVDSNGNGAGGKGQVDKGGEDLHFDICVVCVVEV